METGEADIGEIFNRIVEMMPGNIKCEVEFINPRRSERIDELEDERVLAIARAMEPSSGGTEPDI